MCSGGDVTMVPIVQPADDPLTLSCGSSSFPFPCLHSALPCFLDFTPFLYTHVAANSSGAFLIGGLPAAE